MKKIAIAVIALASAAALYGCSGGNTADPVEPAQSALYHPKNLLVQTAGAAAGKLVRILGEDDTLTTCAAGRAGALKDCISQDLGADAVFRMAAHPRNGALYFLQYGVDAVLVCDGSDGAVSSCAPADGGGQLKAPRAIGFNAAGSVAYVANRDDTLSVCQVSGDGGFSSCSTTDANGALGTPVAVRLVEGDYGSHAYFLNGEATPAITACTLAPNGMPDHCRTERDATFTAPTTIAFAPNGKYAYIGNFDDSVAICQIGDDAALNACRAIPADDRELFAGIQQIAFDTAGANAYFVNARNSSITRCTVNDGGASLGECSPYHIEGFQITTDLALSEEADSRTLLLTSLFDQAIYGCALNADGSFGDSCLRTRFTVE